MLAFDDMTKQFLSERQWEFVARSIMDVFKLLVPATAATGLLVQPIPGILKAAAVVGLASLFGVSVWVFPRGGSHEIR